MHCHGPHAIERHTKAVAQTVDVSCRIVSYEIDCMFKRLEKQASAGPDGAKAALENVQRIHAAILADLKRVEGLEQQVLRQIETGRRG